MADDVKDVAIYTGSEWTSLSELAAGAVDASLPISSDDGTVVLDSPSANNFIVSTGGAVRVRVSDEAIFSVPAKLPDGTMAEPSLSFKDNPNTGLYRVAAGQMGVATGGVNRATFANTLATFATSVKVESSAFSPFNIVSSSENAFIKIDAKDSSWWSGVVGGTYQIQGKPGSSAVSIITVSSDGSVDLPYGRRQLTCLDVIAGGQVRTPTVKGVADTDASINLGSELLTTNHTPTQPNSIATKKIVDEKIWVGSTAEYLAIPGRDILPGTLYCLTD